MARQLDGISIIDIPEERSEEAAEVLALAFDHDPLTRYFFAETDANASALYQDRLRVLMRMACAQRLARGWPLKGVSADGALVGVACITPPDASQSTVPTVLQTAAERFRALIGESAARRLAAYGRLEDAHRRSDPHFYVSVLGVHPKAQGRGYGRILLDAVQALAQAHPAAVGVALDTENPANVALYQHCGYELTVQTTLDTLDVWFMFRANAPDAGRARVR
ncbi:MAG: hypothetical protein PVSMB4_17820 [Ktedonobacterales bacterium]